MALSSVDEFVRGLCAIPKERFTIPGVAEFLQRTPVDPETLTPYLGWEPTHYTRNLIYRCELFELMAICWDVGQASRIHNHQGQNCWMAAPIGRLVVQNYEVAEQDEARGYCRLREADRVELDAAHPAFVHPDRPIHVVENPREHGDRAATLHVYSLPYDHCLVYSLDTSTCADVPLFFDTEYGRPAPPRLTAPPPGERKES